ncbi:hypothetical protein [Mycobacterium tilburgii]|uniref:hypothetical protein n=1 Tax=Mycobacterium tilburgii TaxID=44467 RepID=UPI001182E883|nr:hypothetical protein [Mycobacterium tilburgii]
MSTSLLTHPFARAAFVGGVQQCIFDALIGASLAIVNAVLLFPADPLLVLRSVRLAVLETLESVLRRTGDLALPRSARRGLAVAGGGPGARTAGRLGLIQARHHLAADRAGGAAAVGTSRRGTGRDQQAVRLALLAGSVLQLARVVVPASLTTHGCRRSGAAPRAGGVGGAAPGDRAGRHRSRRRDSPRRSRTRARGAPADQRARELPRWCWPTSSRPASTICSG